MLNDEYFQVREISLRLLASLTTYNLPHVMSFLQKLSTISHTNDGLLFEYKNNIGDYNRKAWKNLQLCFMMKYLDGAFNLNNDRLTKNNFETLIKTGDGKSLEKISKEKLNYYINSKGDGSQSSKFLEGHFSCLLYQTDNEATDSVK